MKWIYSIFDKLSTKGWVKYRTTIYYDSGQKQVVFVGRKILEDILAAFKQKILGGPAQYSTYGSLSVLSGYQFDNAKVSHIIYRASFMGL
jgi:hypothetical protein